MLKEQTIQKDAFIKRFSELCLRSGLSGLPKDELDQHILFKSAAIAFKAGGPFSELDVNEKLGYWVSRISQLKGLDYITLRRNLVDNAYLMRSKDGSSYTLGTGPAQLTFDPKIDQIDLEGVLAAAREEIARRKREYLEKTKK